MNRKPKEQYEHFTRKVKETRDKEYYCSTRGAVFSVDKKTGKVTPIAISWHKSYLRPSTHALNDRQLAHLVWYVAKAEDLRNTAYTIGFIDGNPRNCTIENLRKIPKADKSRITGAMARSQPVRIIENGEEQVFQSCRKAAIHLCCSYQTLLDYLNGRSGHCIQSVRFKPGRKRGSCLVKEGRSIEWVR